MALLQALQQPHEAEPARNEADVQHFDVLVTAAQEVAALGEVLRSALPGLQSEPEGITGQAASSSPCCCANTEDAHALLMLQACRHLILNRDAAAGIVLGPCWHAQYHHDSGIPG